MSGVKSSEGRKEGKKEGFACYIFDLLIYIII